MSTQDNAETSRLKFLIDVARQTSTHLQFTCDRVFAQPMSLERINNLANNPEDAEQIEAFVSRFARLQDSLGARLLPHYLQAVGERQPSLLENLDKAERMGLIHSADDWMSMRKLRNQMVHEYIQDPAILLSALNSGYQFVPHMLQASEKLQQGIQIYLQRCPSAQ